MASLEHCSNELFWGYPPIMSGSRMDDYLTNVMPVMQRFVTVIAVLAENTSTLTLSIFGMSAAAKTPVGLVL
jgi:hypothetical protein